MKRRVPLPITIAIAALCAAVAFLASFFVLDLKYSGALKFAEAWGAVNGYFIGDIEEDEIMDAAIAAAIEATGDKWSYYMTAEEYEEYKLAGENEFVGVGISVMKDEETGGLKIIRVYENSPADKAGIVPGEVITSVDNGDITAITVSEASALISREDGETAVLGIIGADGVFREISVTCGVVYANPVSYELLAEGVGLIKTENFESPSAAEMKAALEALREMEAEGIIFDMRNNPGGKVDELVDILDYILPEGDTFVTVTKEGKEHVDTSNGSCIEMPMAVMVNEGTYSAAEFFAAALQEYGWASVVGNKTTGKGRSQATIALSDGSALHISTKEYYTPNRMSLAGIGVTPDAEVSLSDEKSELLYYGALLPEEDDQLQAAIKILAK